MIKSKGSIVVIAFIVVFFPGVVKPILASPEKEVPQESPKLVFQETEYDFGKTPGEREVSISFQLRNEGNGELILEEPLAWCDATVSIVGPYKVMPGEERTVQVTHNLLGKEGKWHKRIIIRSNDPENPESVLTIQGVAVPAVSLDPPFLTFYDFKKGDSLTRDVFLINNGPLDMEIISIRGSISGVSGTYVSEESSLEKKKLQIVFDGSFPLGAFKETLIVNTDHPDYPSLRLPIFGWVKGSLIVNPSWCSLRVLDPGDRPSQTILITKETGSELEIQSVVSQDQFLTTVLSTIVPGREFSLLIKLVEQADPKKNRSSVIVYTNIEEQPELVIPVKIYFPKSKDISSNERPAVP